MDTLLAAWTPERLAELGLAFLPRVVGAAAVLLAFWLLLRATAPALRNALRRAHFAEALIALLVDNVYRTALMIVALILALGQLGIDIGAALAGVGIVGVAVGFAAQDTLANIIAGFLIFWDKPFQVGQFITTQQHYGEVVHITMRTTRIRTPENTYVVIPNKEIIQTVLVNHTLYGETRVNVPVGIAYKEHIPSARTVILDAVRTLDGILAEPAPEVVVASLGSSSVDLVVRVWVADARVEKPMFFRVMEAAKLALDVAGIQIPYHHLQLFVDDVHEDVWRKASRFMGGSRAAG